MGVLAGAEEEPNGVIHRQPDSGSPRREPPLRFVTDGEAGWLVKVTEIWELSTVVVGDDEWWSDGLAESDAQPVKPGARIALITAAAALVLSRTKNTRSSIFSPAREC